MTGALKPFPTCDTVLQYFKDEAPEYLLERAGPQSARARAQPASRSGTELPGRAVDRASAGAESGGDSPEYSETNIQEAGVDEPDIIKTDGNRIVAVARARVHLISSVDGKLTLRKTLRERRFEMCSSPVTDCWCSAVTKLNPSSLDPAGPVRPS